MAGIFFKKSSIARARVCARCKRVARKLWMTPYLGFADEIEVFFIFPPFFPQGLREMLVDGRRVDLGVASSIPHIESMQ